MDKLGLLKIKAQLAAVTAAKADQEYNLEMKLQEVERLQKAIVIQDDKIKELTEQIQKEE